MLLVRPACGTQVSRPEDRAIPAQLLASSNFLWHSGLRVSHAPVIVALPLPLEGALHDTGSSMKHFAVLIAGLAFSSATLHAQSASSNVPDSHSASSGDVPHLDRRRAAHASAGAHGLRDCDSQASAERACRVRQCCAGERSQCGSRAAAVVELRHTANSIARRAGTGSAIATATAAAARSGGAPADRRATPAPGAGEARGVPVATASSTAGTAAYAGARVAATATAQRQAATSTAFVIFHAPPGIAERHCVTFAITTFRPTTKHSRRGAADRPRHRHRADARRVRDHRARGQLHIETLSRAQHGGEFASSRACRQGLRHRRRHGHRKDARHSTDRRRDPRHDRAQRRRRQSRARSDARDADAGTSSSSRPASRGAGSRKATSSRDDTIIVDEIHQTSAELELCLALGKRVGCRFVWLSATVDPTFYARYLDSADVLEVFDFDPDEGGAGDGRRNASRSSSSTRRFFASVQKEKRGVALFVPTRPRCEEAAEHRAAALRRASTRRSTTAASRFGSSGRFSRAASRSRISSR